MAPEIIRLERAAVCACGELVSAGERAGYAEPPEMVVCLSCLSRLSADPEPEDSSRSGDALLPARWTADATVMAATLRALREDAPPSWPPSDSTVLHVPTEWSTPPPESAPAARRSTAPEQPITLPRRKAATEPRPDADVSAPTDPTEKTAVLPTEPAAALPSHVSPPAPQPEPPGTLPLAPPTVAEAAPQTDTRRARREAAAAEDPHLLAPASRRRAGLFTRLLSVRTFRAQQAQPKVGKSHAAVRALLTEATAKGVLSLHNRRVPGRRGRIEHIAVGAGGIYVIDSWQFKNAPIEVRPVGDAHAGSDDLVVGGRVMTSAVRAMGQRVEVLRMILVAAGLNDVPVTGALCFVDGLLPLSVADLQVGGMHVLRPSCLTALVASPGAYGPADRETLHDFLAERLPAST